MFGVIFNEKFIIFRLFLLELLDRPTRPELTLILPTTESCNIVLGIFNVVLLIKRHI